MLRRGQGDALNVDRHDLYQALYSTIAAAPLGDLEPLRQRPAESAAAPDQAASGGGARNGPSSGARIGPWDGSQIRHRGRNAAADVAPEELPLEVLLVRVANQMLVEQVWALPLIGNS